jgi:hypothetical protein
MFLDANRPLTYLIGMFAKVQKTMQLCQLCLLSICLLAAAPTKTSGEMNIIDLTCFDPLASHKLSSLGVKLRKFQNQFADVDQRNKHSALYVQALNQTVQDMGFGYLLKCHPFQVEATDSDMEVDRKENSNLFIVKLNLASSVQRTLPTYMHELLHICQADKSDAIYREGNVEKINRNIFLKEIAAFQLMERVYQQAIRADHQFCFEDLVSKESRDSLAKTYSTGLHELSQGIFAQRVLQWYVNTDRFKDRTAGVFQLNSEKIDYPESQNGSAFQMHRLDPKFELEILKMGIPVKQGP